MSETYPSTVYRAKARLSASASFKFAGQNMAAKRER